MRFSLLFIAACRPLCGPVSGLAGLGRENTRPGISSGRVWPVWGQFGKASESQVLGQVWARSEKKLSTGSKVKREKMQGLLLHPCMVHRARQCRSLREFSDFRARKQKGVAKFVFREKWGCKPDKRRYSANIPGLRRQKGVLQDFGTKGQI